MNTERKIEFKLDDKENTKNNVELEINSESQSGTSDEEIRTGPTEKNLKLKRKEEKPNEIASSKLRNSRDVPDVEKELVIVPIVTPNFQPKHAPPLPLELQFSNIDRYTVGRLDGKNYWNELLITLWENKYIRWIKKTNSRLRYDIDAPNVMLATHILSPTKFDVKHIHRLQIANYQKLEKIRNMLETISINDSELNREIMMITSGLMTIDRNTTDIWKLISLLHERDPVRRHLSVYMQKWDICTGGNMIFEDALLKIRILRYRQSNDNFNITNIRKERMTLIGGPQRMKDEEIQTNVDEERKTIHPYMIWADEDDIRNRHITSTYQPSFYEKIWFYFKTTWLPLLLLFLAYFNAFNVYKDNYKTSAITLASIVIVATIVIAHYKYMKELGLMTDLIRNYHNEYLFRKCVIINVFIMSMILDDRSGNAKSDKTIKISKRLKTLRTEIRTNVDRAKDSIIGYMTNDNSNITKDQLDETLGSVSCIEHGNSTEEN